MAKRLLNLIRRRHVIRPCDVDVIGVPRNYLSRLAQRAKIHKLDRGLYVSAEAKVSEHVSLAEVCRRAPKATVCLLSALRFHELGTQSPVEVWIALDSKAWAPRIKTPRIRIVRFSGKALRFGVLEEKRDGVVIRVTSPAKTVADCFKFRNKIGMDVALEALRDCRRQKKASMNQLWEAAKICRVANVMRPYLEMLG
jgi:predicted transcriptional regulator of viral defense system